MSPVPPDRHRSFAKCCFPETMTKLWPSHIAVLTLHKPDLRSAKMLKLLKAKTTGTTAAAGASYSLRELEICEQSASSSALRPLRGRRGRTMGIARLPYRLQTDDRATMQALFASCKKFDSCRYPRVDTVLGNRARVVTTKRAAMA